MEKMLRRLMTFRDSVKAGEELLKLKDCIGASAAGCWVQFGDGVLIMMWSRFWIFFL